MSTEFDETMEVDGGPDCGTSASSMAASSSNNSTLSHGGGGHSSSMSQLPKIDENEAFTDDYAGLKRFVVKLDQLDDQVEKLRREALKLQDQRDSLLTEFDVIRTNQNLAELDEYEQEQIECHLHRLSTRLGTIELCVKTVRDSAQEDSLHEINRQIDALITLQDRSLSRQRCQSFLNCFIQPANGGGSGGGNAGNDAGVGSASLPDADHLNPIDKTFQSCLTGCTLDDQKQIRKRLIALNIYLTKQTISA